MKNISLTLLSFLFLLCFTACKKKDAAAQLPDATHKGANTLGFLVNGEVRATSGKSDNVISTGTEYFNWYDTTIEISGVSSSTSFSQRFNLSFRLRWNRDLGLYPLTYDYPCRAVYMNFPDGSTIPTGTNQYKNDDLHTGQVSITYWDGNIIAGTFNMDLVNDSGDVVHITDGRFDIGQ